MKTTLATAGIACGVKSDSGQRLTVSVARSACLIEDAQRLRYEVFAEELGARIGGDSGLDVDEFDRYCDHIVVQDLDTLRVVGTYRVLPPHGARAIGQLYSESEFDLSRLDHLRLMMVEAGRSCVHRDYRAGPAIMLLWAALARYMKAYGYRYLFGCASVPLADGGAQAAFVREVVQAHLTAPELRVFPRLPCPHAQLGRAVHADLPPLIKGYLRLGAQVAGEPAWDPVFDTADFPMLLAIDRLDPRYARHFDLPAATRARPTPAHAS